MIRIAHVLYRLDYGGMENGLVNLVNRLPDDQFEHSILCLTHATDFQHRIERDNVRILEFNKPEGNDLGTMRAIRKALRGLQPDVVHSRNIGTLDVSIVSRLAGCPVHVHGEHGWNAADLSGSSGKHKLLRRICDPFVRRYVAVSSDIRDWLVRRIGIRADKVTRIRNGVDVERFNGDADRSGTDNGEVTFGTIGRQEPIKGLDVFIGSVERLVARRPDLRGRLRVTMAGDGPDHAKLASLVDDCALSDVVELPGVVPDVPALLRRFDFFVQPSLNEGISNTILEAMATGLPVIATRVGGNPELLRDGIEGSLVEAGDADGLAAEIERFVDDASLRRSRGAAARRRAVEEHSLDTMVSHYAEFYRAVAA